MAKPKHKRCQVCGGVTSRYSHAEKAGPFAIHVWVTDPTRGHVSRRNGTETYCTTHAPEEG